MVVALCLACHPSIKFSLQLVQCGLRCLSITFDWLDSAEEGYTCIDHRTMRKNKKNVKYNQVST